MNCSAYFSILAKILYFFFVLPVEKKNSIFISLLTLIVELIKNLNKLSREFKKSFNQLFFFFIFYFTQKHHDIQHKNPDFLFFSLFNWKHCNWQVRKFSLNLLSSDGFTFFLIFFYSTYIFIQNIMVWRWVTSFSFIPWFILWCENFKHYVMKCFFKDGKIVTDFTLEQLTP